MPAEISYGSRLMTGTSRFWILSTVASMLGIVGCAHLPQPERDNLVQASCLYSQGNVNTARAKTDEIIRKYNSTEEIAEAYYLRGLCRYQANDPDGATSDFHQALLRCKRSDLKPRVRASLGTIYFRQRNWNRAAIEFERALDELPNDPPTDQVLYAAGIAMQRSGDWEGANAQFGRILLWFRNRPIVEQARRMSTWQHDYFSIQLGAFIDNDNAAQTVRTYRAQGLDAVQENRPINGRNHWIVMAGRYATYTDALNALPRLRRIKSDACIIP